MERHIVESRKLHIEDFGFRGREDENTPGPQLLEATMQTGDSNIVRLSFSIEYDYRDPFGVLFRVKDTDAVVRDASQAAMREVVARMTVDEVLREQRALVTSDVENLLQDILDSYGSGLRVESVQLQGVEPPARVRAAFDAVMESGQDATRMVNEAEGYRNEMVPKSHAEAAELVAAAEAYRDSKIAEATGEAARFTAVAIPAPSESAGDPVIIPPPRVTVNITDTPGTGFPN